MTQEDTRNILRQETRALIERHEMTIQAAADRMGISRPTLSLFLDNKYRGDNQEVAEKVAAFLEDMTGVPHVARIRGELMGMQSRGFYQSMDARNIIKACDDARRDEALAVIVGQSGYGKTHALKLASKRDKTLYIESNESMSCRDLAEGILSGLGIRAVNGSIWQKAKAVIEHLSEQRGWLLIIDEADKLISRNTIKKVELLRSIFDQAKCGLVLAGEPQLGGLIKHQVPRLANRVDMWLDIRGLSGEEVEAYMNEYQVTPEALDELKRRAYGGKSACFRLFDRTLRNCFRLMNDRGEREITIKIVQEASNRMML